MADSNKMRTNIDRIPRKGMLKYHISLQIAWPVIASVGIVGSRVQVIMLEITMVMVGMNFFSFVLGLVTIIGF